jgi:acetylglutamate kinase
LVQQRLIWAPHAQPTGTSPEEVPRPLRRSEAFLFSRFDARMVPVISPIAMTRTTRLALVPAVDAHRVGSQERP